MIKIKIKNLLLTLVLTLALLLSGTATVFATNHKSTNAFADTDDTVFYFGDNMYMSLSQNDIQDINNYYIKIFKTEVLNNILDNSQSDINDFINATSYNLYDTNMGSFDVSNCTVVFEFAGMMPNINKLDELVASIDSTCSVVLLSSYPSENFEDIINNYNVEFIQLDLITNFASDFARYVCVDRTDFWQDDAVFRIFFDSRMINYTSGDTFDEIKESSYILKCILDEIEAQAPDILDSQMSENFDDSNLKFYVHVSGSLYYDLINGQNINLNNLQIGENDMSYLVGFWQLDNTVYNDFKELSRTYWGRISVNIIALEYVVFSVDGLTIRNYEAGISATKREEIEELFNTF